MPVFWLGIVGLLVFYAKLRWSPARVPTGHRVPLLGPRVTHLMLIDTALAGEWEAFRNAVSHLVLPASLLGLIALGYIARMTRSFAVATAAGLHYGLARQGPVRGRHHPGAATRRRAGAGRSP